MEGERSTEGDEGEGEIELWLGLGTEKKIRKDDGWYYAKRKEEGGQKRQLGNRKTGQEVSLLRWWACV